MHHYTDNLGGHMQDTTVPRPSVRNSVVRKSRQLHHVEPDSLLNHQSVRSVRLFLPQGVMHISKVSPTHLPTWIAMIQYTVHWHSKGAKMHPQK